VVTDGQRRGPRGPGLAQRESTLLAAVLLAAVALAQAAGAPVNSAWAASAPAASASAIAAPQAWASAPDVSASAGAGATLGPVPGGAAMRAELVKTGLYLITGQGGNSLLRMSAAGSILIDAKLPGAYRPLMSQVRRLSRLSDLPVRVLVLTDHRAAQAGNAAEFRARGIPVLIPESARRELEAADPAPAEAQGRAPLITYEREYRLRLGGVEALVRHVGPAQTADAAIVHLTDLKVVALGGLYTRQAPEPDVDAGGSLPGWSRALAAVLALDFDVAVPADGPAVDRVAVEAFKTRLDTLIARATVLVRSGADSDALMARLQTQDLGWRLSMTPESWRRFHAELSGSIGVPNANPHPDPEPVQKR
jgi:hypothetical protein